ncbi:MAG: hypothetical protein COV08_02975 [Candidatus Vogelbacteria bacterium CG10_big_fil_rev_8_21_14_0_10_49_38]|uniref:M23ase beta-sheet core domain-containing protein n=1 Tax=Candidatus Vogelbacteria bacterium CG10_big_fil_rev_8_21_14_0_10_49_38 TaxID=1975043 RepID=A0A2H0RIH8_9BACT|nr:MAG: hypothetical protein BK006_02985 [bacterium CG10_49_38]PIR45834.1 MAG: hypothetical protein COV08_02975 [Candidatus Vogelbacteria bacterium CG10_big_fil_rev_8_21_14_0_10_49_38]
MRKKLLSQLKFTRQILLIAGLTIMIMTGLVALKPATLSAQTIEELRRKIQSHESEIKKLDEEIDRYRKEISQTKEVSASLAQEIKRLEAAKAKLRADIAVTRNKISITDLNIQRLDQGIKTAAEQIEADRDAIKETFRQINEQEQISLPELLAGTETAAALWTGLDRYQSLNRGLETQITRLRQNKKNLEGDKQEKEAEKRQLSTLERQLADQRQITEATQRDKDSLLSATKNQEANYQKLLTDRLKKKRQVEAEIRKAETELQYVLDPTKLPTAGTGVLAWPLAKIKLTQSFGHTNFSKSPAGMVYNGNGHNGIDLSAATGDRVLVAESGVVLGQGDTDQTCRAASYGKWILIGHDNGLATLYAHLSAIKVTEGQRVTRSQLIGYSGNTGYTTGPHLHFSVIVREAVKVGTLQSKVPGCGVYRLPLASYSAYLNPLNYL